MVSDSVRESAVLHRDLHQNPHEVVEASGNYLVLSDGRRIFDATGGAAVSCIGHGNKRVQEAISSQVARLDFCHSLFFQCPSSETLSQFLIDSTDGQMSKVFIINSGSEAMDAALKLSRQYFMELSPPEPRRVRFIARQGSYHGNTLGALGVSGHKLRRSIYEDILNPLVSFVSACNTYRGMSVDETIEAYVERLASELDAEFQKADPTTVCAFIAEPVVGAALGCVPSVPGYFKAMKAVCDKYGALLIMDEVMSGIGRTGTLHAWQQEGVVPDIQTVGKGLGGGYAPIAGILIGHRVINTLDDGTGQFLHGQTYQAHPMVCAAALEVQHIIKEDKLLDNVVEMGKLLESKLKATFANNPFVGNIRGRGLFWGLEFVADKATKMPFDASYMVAMTIHQEGIKQSPGIMLYPGVGSADGKLGDHLLIAPAYNVTKEDIELIVDSAAQAINRVFSRMSLVGAGEY